MAKKTTRRGIARSTANIRRINPRTIARPFANYAHVVTVEGAKRLVFCAGQVAADASGKVLPPKSFEAQTKMVMKNLKNALAAGGATFSDVTKVTIHICNPHDVPKARGILSDYFGKNPPGRPRFGVGRGGQPQFRVGVEAHPPGG
jgi:enamine deaminase RidA (YjgF/YER057c/UK114 family)